MKSTFVTVKLKIVELKINWINYMKNIINSQISLH